MTANLPLMFSYARSGCLVVADRRWRWNLAGADLHAAVQDSAASGVGALSLLCLGDFGDFERKISCPAAWLMSGRHLSLEITTLIFSYIGGRAVSWISAQVLAFAFAAILAISAVALIKPRKEIIRSPKPSKHGYLLAMSGVIRGAQHGRLARYRRRHRSGSGFAV